MSRIVAVRVAPERCWSSVNLPPFAAASHTSSNSSVRDLARMIASLVALSAANMRVRRSFCASAFAFSSARSKLSSANDTFSAIRASSATISSSAAQDLPTKNSRTPTLSPALIRGTATQAIDAGLASGLLPRLPLRRVQDIVVDARLLRPERLAADAAAIGVVRIDREARPRDLLDDFTRPGDRLQPDRARLRKQGPPWRPICRCGPRHRKRADRVPARSWREEWLRWSR